MEPRATNIVTTGRLTFVHNVVVELTMETSILLLQLLLSPIVFVCEGEGGDAEDSFFATISLAMPTRALHAHRMSPPFSSLHVSWSPSATSSFLVLVSFF